MSKLDKFGKQEKKSTEDGPAANFEEEKPRKMPVKGVQMRPEVMRAFRQLAAQKDVKEWELMHEALEDLFDKYNVKMP